MHVHEVIFFQQCSDINRNGCSVPASYFSFSLGEFVVYGMEHSQPGEGEVSQFFNLGAAIEEIDNATYQVW